MATWSIGLSSIVITWSRGSRRRCWKWIYLLQRGNFVEAQPSLCEYLVGGYENCFEDSENASDFNIVFRDMVTKQEFKLP